MYIIKLYFYIFISLYEFSVMIQNLLFKTKTSLFTINIIKQTIFKKI